MTTEELREQLRMAAESRHECITNARYYAGRGMWHLAQREIAWAREWNASVRYWLSRIGQENA